MISGIKNRQERSKTKTSPWIPKKRETATEEETTWESVTPKNAILRKTMITPKQLMSPPKTVPRITCGRKN